MHTEHTEIECAIAFWAVCLCSCAKFKQHTVGYLGERRYRGWLGQPRWN